MDVARYPEIESYPTKDGSTIREWFGPGSAAANQSLAEATIAPGAATTAHYHRTSEEIYLVTAGGGRLRIGERECDVEAGDCALIPPGAIHRIENTSDEDLVIVCACSPPYSHEDTFLCEED